MVRIQKRISLGMEVLQYFTTREWLFHNTKFMKIHEMMSLADQKMFTIRCKNVDVKDYFKNVILGSRVYCMKEDLSTLPKARRHQRM